MRPFALASLTLLLLLNACSSLEYDLAGLPFPVSAQPAADRVATEPFVLEDKSILWVHGLFGESNPDVAELLAEAGAGRHGIANFRVTRSGGFHDWLVVHLSLTLVRMKSVTIQGEWLLEAPPAR